MEKTNLPLIIRLKNYREPAVIRGMKTDRFGFNARG
jgi:hypothetical protein